MTVSGVKGNPVFGCFSKVGKKEVTQTEAPQKKVNVKKALAIASAAAAAVGLGLIAVNKIRKGKGVDTLSRLKTEGADYVKQVTTQNKAEVALTHVNNQIADVASRTKKGCVGARMEELAEAFGAAVIHVPQKASIVA